MSEIEIFGRQLNILSGFPFKSADFNSKGKGLPIIRIRDLLKHNSETYFSGKYDKSYLVSKGDVLVGMDGDFNAVKWKGTHSLLNQRICKLSTKDPYILDQDYLYHFLQPQLNRIHKTTAQTTVKHLSVKDLFSIDSEIPPLREQKKIADILSSIQNKISFLYSKSKQLSNLYLALSSDIFSKYNNQVQLKDIVDLEVGFPFKSKDFQNTGIRLLRGENVGYGLINWANKQCLPLSVAEKSFKYNLNAGDIVVGMDRSFTKSGFKISQISENDLPCLLVQRVGRFVPNDFPKRFIWHLLNSKNYQRQLILSQKGMDIPHLSKKDILDSFVPLVPINEISKIVEALDSVSRSYQKIINQIRKMELFAKGLSNEMLSSNKRTYF